MLHPNCKSKCEGKHQHINDILVKDGWHLTQAHPDSGFVRIYHHHSKGFHNAYISTGCNGCSELPPPEVIGMYILAKDALKDEVTTGSQVPHWNWWNK